MYATSIELKQLLRVFWLEENEINGFFTSFGLKVWKGNEGTKSLPSYFYLASNIGKFEL